MSWDVVYLVVSILLLPTIIIGSAVQINVHNVFNSLNKVPSKQGITANKLCEILLDRSDVHGVSVHLIDGNLTDCYDSKKKVVNLSSSTYNSTSIASLGVCAHEVGHAVQDSRKMLMFRLRSLFVPIINLISKLCMPLLVIGMLFSFLFYIPTVGYYIIWVSVVFYGASLLYYLLTLPLEFNASRRALRMLKINGLMDEEELKLAKQVLRAAALTYVLAFLTSLLYFLRFLSILMVIFGGRGRK